MARLRRRASEPEPEQEPAGAVQVTARDRLDHRVYLEPRAPWNQPGSTPQHWLPEVALAWALEHAPSWVLDDHQAEQAARQRHAQEELRALPIEEQRRLLEQRRARAAERAERP